MSNKTVWFLRGLVKRIAHLTFSLHREDELELLWYFLYQPTDEIENRKPDV